MIKNTKRIRQRVAIYARTLNKKASLEEQVFNCRTFAVKQGWQTFDIYTDHNCPDLRTDRPALMLLKHEAAARYFDIILCEHSDWLTPNVWEQRDILVSFDKLGIRPWSVQEGDLDELRIWLQINFPD